MSIKKYSSGSWVTVPYRKYETATDTITSLPQTIIGDGQNISAYTIKGNMSQSGTPTPSNPIYPQETGDKTANLFDKADTSLQSHLCYNSNNDTLKIGLAIGSIVLPCSPNTTYSIRRKGGLSDTFNACYTTETPDENVSAYGYVESSDRYTYGLTITTGANAAYLIIVMYNSNFENPGTWQQMVDNLVVVEGSTVPSEYIPFGYKIPILSNGVAYPVYLAEPLRKIGDSVDTAPSTGTATYNIKKLVITGEERWYESNGLFYFAPTNFTNRSIVLCTHYPYYDGAGTSAPDKSVLTKYGGGLSIWIKDSSYTTLADFKQFLADQYAAGTPVTVWYVLATAQTESFTAPSIPTSGTAQTFDVDTTLKPSEVSLTYHGWHEHSDNKKSANLFDYTTMADGGDGYLGDAGGINANSQWKYTDYIPCNGTNFVLSKVGGNNPSICFYDENKQFISGQKYSTGGTSIKADIIATASANAKYIRFSYMIDGYPDDLSALMLSNGTIPIPYEPYWE